MSGHSKWATIKHKKGAADAKRGKLFSKLIREITVAAKMGGGDPGGNPRLRKAISTAKGNQMPNDTIDRAVKRGTGELEGVAYEEILYEGTGPSGTLWLVQAMTDNRNRTVSEIRKLFEKQNGALGGGGSAAWAFERKGIVLVPASGVDEDKIMEVALEAGAENYERADESWQVLCDVSGLDAVTAALEQAGIKVDSSTPGYVPKMKKMLAGRDAERALSMFEGLDDHDDVQAVYADWDIADDEMQRIAAATA
jgi:YebC/PmpR family DNA-binding regulatory protein